MKCICIRDCYIKHGRSARRFRPGEVAEFGECPKNIFRPVKDMEIDFEKSGIQALMLSDKWSDMDAIEFIESKGGEVGLETNRKELALKIIDSRERYIKKSDLK